MLREANLTGANLSEAELIEAGLSGADLTKANLSGAALSKADLSGVNLTEVIGLTPQQLETAIIDETTRLADEQRATRHTPPGTQ